MEAESSESPAKGSNTKKIIIIVVVLLVACLVVCGLIALASGLFVQKGLNDFTNELNKQLDGQVGDELKKYEQQLRELSGSEDEGSLLELLGQQQWPASMPQAVPQFNYGEMLFSTNNEDGNGWTVTYMRVDPDSIDKYKADLEASGWDVKDIASGTYLQAFHSSGFQLQAYIGQDTAALTVTEE